MVTAAAPHHLIADGGPLWSVRRTRAGDAHDRRQAASCGAPAPGSPAVVAPDDRPRPVGLGMPTLRT